MARRGWGGSIATAVGVAAGAGAAQLGFGYGLGIINWAPADASAGATAWVAGLIWATWIAATSTACGAVCAQRLRDRAPVPDDATVAPPDGVLRHVALAVAAGVGALVTVLLVAVPARAAVGADTGSPRNVAAGYAAVGVLVGVLTAVWTLRSRAAANNVIATVGWLWLLAVVAVVDGVLAGRGLTSAQLGIWQLSSDDGRFWIRDYFYWPGALLSLCSALVIGALAARGSARHADRRVGAAASGAAGPLLVATAYFLAVPRLTAISPEQVSAHLIAPYAVIVGVGGSVLVAALAQRAARRAALHGPVTVPRQRTAEPSGVPGDPAPAGQPVPAGTDTDTILAGPVATGADLATPVASGVDPDAAGGPVPAPAAAHPGTRTVGAARPARPRKPAADAGGTPTGPGTAGAGPAGATAGVPARAGDPGVPTPGDDPTSVSREEPTAGEQAADADSEGATSAGRRNRAGRRTR
ncbi:hypothetical protein ACSNOB_26255 [Micromonospora sp. URMC 106]|uniref:hypothetical protein n=1 Tax=Micromonospora sp. URMC 106 TaxID=3423408 RepID=UPI003F1B2307